MIVLFIDNDEGNELIIQTVHDFHEAHSFINWTLQNWKTGSFKEVTNIRIDIQENR